jgi:L-threonylcarbamoyladenylate synthase
MTSMVFPQDTLNLQQAADFLREGGLVAFPTETVYGLGANASKSEAVAQVFAVKGRPAQDPLIVHGASSDQLRSCVSPDASFWQMRVFEVLSAAFWPGPLTLILPAAADRIVPEVTARSGWVGLRCPHHPVALKFLELCGCPVAAPSANLFGHVSPTTAQHVFDDFPDVDNLWIVDGGSCGFGIESTVVRVNADESIDLLRRGGVGFFELQSCLQQKGLIPLSDEGAQRIRVVEKYVKSESQSDALCSPGQLLTHYAPRIPSWMVSWRDDSAGSSAEVIEQTESMLRQTVLVDFGGRFSALASRVGFYRDLSQTGSVTDAVRVLFETLRWAEKQFPTDSADGRLWIFDPRPMREQWSEDIFLALSDRVLRSASGRALEIGVTPDFGRVYASVR